MWTCPNCLQLLRLDSQEQRWSCPTGHQFDCAREGYVNLLPSNHKRSLTPGDSPAMLAARRRVHDAGFYQPLADGIHTMLKPLAGVKRMLDLGCGEGFYCTALTAAFPMAELAGVDIAKTAVKLAAKRHRFARFAVASAVAVPLPAGTMHLVASVFAPTTISELRRVLAPGGYYCKVTPAPRHLWELREALYDNPRLHAEPDRGQSGLALVQSQAVTYRAVLDAPQLADLVAMTPFAYRGQRERREQLLQRDGLSLQMAFGIDLYRVPGTG